MTAQRLTVVRDAPARPTRRAPKSVDDQTVVGQVRVALRRDNRLAASLGGLLGGGVPVASWQLAHFEVDATQPLWAQLGAWLVLGGLLFSAVTVFTWSRQAFRSTAKALGYTVLLEGVLTTAKTPWLSVAALMVLVAINAVATGCNLANKRR